MNDKLLPDWLIQSIQDALNRQHWRESICDERHERSQLHNKERNFVSKVVSLSFKVFMPVIRDELFVTIRVISLSNVILVYMYML